MLQDAKKVNDEATNSLLDLIDEANAAKAAAETLAW